MPTFEVYIPAVSDADMNVTLTVDAQNWLGALRTGLVNLGEDPQVITNIMCDIQSDNSIHVTDLVSGRVFRLVQAGVVPAPVPLEVGDAEVVEEQTIPEMPAPVVAAPSDTKPIVAAPSPATSRERFRPAPEPLTRSETRPTPSDPKIGRREEKVSVEDVLTEIFERTQELYAEHLDPDRIVNMLIDLAVEKIPSGAGTLYVADISAHDLQFAAVRGPKAKEILSSGLRVPMGQGIAGFCAQEGVALTIGDVQRDPRFAREISEKIGYDAHSMICAPMEKDGRCYGAIQLINREGTTAFSQADLDILASVAQQGVELLSKVQT
jgi:putative methionine-R-sulfoxide reductase with GAF domain